MLGASFIRSDLHVHTFPDVGDVVPELEDYIRQARDRDIDVLGVTDHNTVRNVEEKVTLGRSAGVLVLPGNRGHHPSRPSHRSL